MTKDPFRPSATIVALAVLFGCVKLACGQPLPQSPGSRAPQPAVTFAAAEASRSDAKPCVLLRNDNVLFGFASQLGEYVIVRRGVDNEIRLPRKDVVCWANSIEDLYRYRVDHRRTGDIGAHLKDAHWCLRFDLHQLAQAEIEAVLAIDSRNDEAKRLQRRLQRYRSAGNSTPATPSGDETASADDSQPIVQPVGYDDHEPDLSGVGLRALSNFAGNVQPMLFNRCGHCHSQASDRPWQLLTPGTGTRASSRMTRENLAACLKFIVRESPADSELWVMATTPHGGGPAPLDPRRAKTLFAMQQWLESLRQSPSAFSPDGRSGDRQTGGTYPFPETQSSESQQPPKSLDRWLSDRPQLPETPARLPEVANPFDPDLFNRRYHAE